MQQGASSTKRDREKRRSNKTKKRESSKSNRKGEKEGHADRKINVYIVAVVKQNILIDT
jgi:hypothetical protein